MPQRAIGGGLHVHIHTTNWHFFNQMNFHWKEDNSSTQRDKFHFVAEWIELNRPLCWLKQCGLKWCKVSILVKHPQQCRHSLCVEFSFRQSRDSSEVSAQSKSFNFLIYFFCEIIWPKIYILKTSSWHRDQQNFSCDLETKERTIKIVPFPETNAQSLRLWQVLRLCTQHNLITSGLSHQCIKVMRTQFPILQSLEVSVQLHRPL